MQAEAQSPTQEAVLSELQHVLEGPALARSPQLQDILKYLVTETIAGRADRLKAFNIAVDVLGRPSSFDPATDTIVRVQAGRLRTALEAHYAGARDGCSVVIDLPKGSYVPTFRTITKAGAGDEDVEASGNLPQAPSDDGPTRAEIWSALTKLSRPFAFLAVALLCVVVATTVISEQWQPLDHRIASEPPFNTLVLARLASLSGQVEEQRLADALTSELAQSIARPGIIHLQLSASEVRGPDVALQTIARQFKARWAIAGTLHGTADRQRVNVFLMDGPSGGIVWSQSYDTPGSNVDPDQLADRIVFDLRPQLYSAAKRLLATKPKPTPLEQFVLATWFPGEETNSLAWQQERIRLAREAIAHDGGLGEAHSVLADKLSLLANLVPSFDTEETRREADAAAHAASVLAPRSSEVAFNLALHSLHTGRLADATKLVEKTLALSPRHTLARFWRMVLPYNCTKAPDSVVNELARFDAELSPGNPARWQTKAWLARMFLNRGEYGAAIDAAGESLLIVPNLGAALILIVATSEAGKSGESRQIFQDQLKLWPDFSFQHYNDVALPRMCANSPELAHLQAIHRTAAAALE